MRYLWVICLLAPFAAEAQTSTQLYPPLPGVEYYCTDSYGDRVELGSVICVTASCQTYMVRCEMVAQGNMAMWRQVQHGCPTVFYDRLKALQPSL